MNAGGMLDLGKLVGEDLGDGLELSHSIFALMRIFGYPRLLGHQDLHLTGPYFP